MWIGLPESVLSSSYPKIFVKSFHGKMVSPYNQALTLGYWLPVLLGYRVLETPTYVLGILLPNRAKPTFQYNRHLLSLPSGSEVLASGQSPTN